MIDPKQCLVVKAMEESLILKSIHLVGTLWLVLGHILNLMAKENQPIDEIHNKLPELFMKKTKFPREGAKVEDLFRKLQSGFPDGTVSNLDGLRISWILDGYI
jgi:hypothetical protein